MVRTQGHSEVANNMSGLGYKVIFETVNSKFIVIEFIVVIEQRLSYGYSEVISQRLWQKVI